MHQLVKFLTIISIASRKITHSKASTNKKKASRKSEQWKISTQLSPIRHTIAENIPPQINLPHNQKNNEADIAALDQSPLANVKFRASGLVSATAEHVV